MIWVFPLFQEQPIHGMKSRIPRSESSKHRWELVVDGRLRLVLSCGTDSILCLWRITSVASAPLGAKAGQDRATVAGRRVGLKFFWGSVSQI